ncbi:hypothetical protein Asi03nite_06550 [Actinoplanes siamensis]|uniref:Transposase DDE domain-containing protein n=1 Tax=Actinoplanes siamensis TaxID=1223317 RepID=A0A919MX28_9ACTN|nr:hypothetical protein Asi03nite_06550 [Actinoplanes siamensis]
MGDELVGSNINLDGSGRSGHVRPPFRAHGTGVPKYPSTPCFIGANDTELREISKARAKVRARVWDLLARRPAGFPWLTVAGKLPTGWVIIDLDATLITAHSPKQGAAATFERGFGFHPLGGWCANTGESLATLLRPGNAGSNTVADHIQVLADAIGQLPVAYRRKILIRIDGAGATRDLFQHLEQMNRLWRRSLFCPAAFGIAGIRYSQIVFRGDRRVQNLGDDLTRLGGAHGGTRVDGGHAAGRQPPRDGGHLMATRGRETGAGRSGSVAAQFRAAVTRFLGHGSGHADDQP